MMYEKHQCSLTKQVKGKECTVKLPACFEEGSIPEMGEAHQHTSISMFLTQHPKVASKALINLRKNWPSGFEADLKRAPLMSNI